MTQMMKNLLAMQETQVRSLCREDPLEKGMATEVVQIAVPSYVLFPLAMGSQRVGHD